MINQIGQCILVRRGSSFLSNGEEVRRPNEGWIFWEKVYMYFYSRYESVLTNRVNRYIIYTNVLFFFLLCFITSIYGLYFKLQKREMKIVQPQQPPCGIVNAYKTRYDLWFTISLLSLSSAVKSDAGKWLHLLIKIKLIYKINIVNN